MQITPQELTAQLREGYVSVAGARMLWEAECYGNVSSLNCLRSWLRDLENGMIQKSFIEVEGEGFIRTNEEYLGWIERRFPETYECFFKDEGKGA